MTEPGSQETPYPEPGEPPVPDKALQLQILLILCLSVYIITAICLLLKSYCIAYGTLDFTSTPATTPDHTAAWNSLQRLKSLNRVAPLKRYDSWYISAVCHERSPLLSRDWENSICAICLETVNKDDVIHALPFAPWDKSTIHEVVSGPTEPSPERDLDSRSSLLTLSLLYPENYISSSALSALHKALPVVENITCWLICLTNALSPGVMERIRLEEGNERDNMVHLP
ncbi:hypothetical protein M752DRAFT_268757 [Aspergillus phoenicis ATCC 13157]|uniref:Uncharacterized protein n=1 Tax=Aspergillus phoenicis ATCC 13157 TaxID=1353007 RepID=A0A370PC13_ASPPH|nr:hypothetical protein M752DRAFT_268757 [Aspergillus phoenicis ATCC 13157]